MTGPKNTEFELGGINHLALVSSDMKRTVDFYSGVLGMPLIKTIELPAGMGQHFFFDCGGGDCVAFFWFPDAPDGVPGLSAPANRPEQGDLVSAVGSMNHVAFHVPPDKFEEYWRRLQDKGVTVSPIINHDDSPLGIAREFDEGVFVRSFYFQDPDGILLEFACWTRTFTDADVSHEPKTAADRTAPKAVPVPAAAVNEKEQHAPTA
ncbi:VOC family protein [Actinomadura keratinilytica]|jgi:catechol 2,3-dioxygenase-like lactoylglutathione lyase family enzyme|uniref:VOC family protein n=1 Tax=Actinomadura keratinilytica TaxID=547461 RepID=A0ABP7XVW5_9ACTN